MNIYSLYDKVAKRHLSLTICESDEVFVRQSLLPILMDYALEDVEFFQVGVFDNESGLIKPCVPRRCDWDCYKFPRDRGRKNDFLTMEDLIKFARNKKHEFIESSKNNVEELNKLLDIQRDELEKAKKENNTEKIKSLKAEIKQTFKDIERLEKFVKKGA